MTPTKALLRRLILAPSIPSGPSAWLRVLDLAGRSAASFDGAGLPSVTDLSRSRVSPDGRPTTL